MEASRGPRIDHTRGEKRNNFVLSLRVRRRIWIMKSTRQIMTLRMRSYGTGRIFDRLKNLTVHFVHTEPFNIFVLFARNFIIVRLKCFVWTEHRNAPTPSPGLFSLENGRETALRTGLLNARIFNRSKVRSAPC